jgi:GNAT superfamily N-acetyltransferase
MRSADYKISAMQREDTFDELVGAWLTARSVARGLPEPVPEFGGFRVETNSDQERVRWVFPKFTQGLVELGTMIRDPAHIIKLCGSRDRLRRALPDRWMVHEPSYFMTAGSEPPPRELPPGYQLEVECLGPVAIACITRCVDGELAARGFGAAAAGVFIYDRIETNSDDRRKGLGTAVMLALWKAKPEPNARELLVATQEGRVLYERLGWQVLSPYSTASIPRHF